MEEVVAIIAIFVVLPAIIVQAVTTVKKAKYKAMEGGGGELRASELQRLIREAVEDAVEPLYDRIDALEGRGPAGRPEAGGRLDPAALADAFDDPEADDDPAAVRRRARS